MSIVDNIQHIRAQVPDGVKIVAVSKFHPVDKLLQAYEAGLRTFGESRQQELLQKIPQMPSDTQWHFIGHLQTNKVRSIVGKVGMIESVDSEKLLTLIDHEAQKIGVVQPVLLQVHVAMEETKFGFAKDEIVDLFRSHRYQQLQAVKLRGIMGMASNTEDVERVRADFMAIKDIYQELRKIAPELEGFDQISMGMSHDFHLAIDCGSTMVRIGTAIFGDREY